MKKRYYVFIITALAVILSGILPAFLSRISYEREHKGFVPALEINTTIELFENKEAFLNILSKYKESGITTAVIREEENSFDEEKLKLSKESGLDVALMVYGGNKKPDDYEKKLNAVIDKYDAEYILLKENNEKGYEIPVSDIILKNNLTLVLLENKNQLSNEMPEGYSDYVESANGRIMRAFETYYNPGMNIKAGEYNPETNDLLYYQMLNSARDRNTEFLIINQIRNDNSSAEENAEYTCRSVEKFCTWMENSGYEKGKQPDLSGYEVNTNTVASNVAFLGALMIIALCGMLFKTKSGIVEWIIYAVGVVAYLITPFMPEFFVGLYPTLFAVISSCFCFQLAFYTADKLKNSLNGIWLGIIVFSVAGASLAFCSFVMSALLSGADYYLNNKVFSGVSAALLIPVIYSSFSCYYSLKEEKLDIKKILKSFELKHYIIFAGMLILAAIYLIRSGNSKISMFETTLRNTLNEFTKARPRTKEILIGWPCLALAVYYIKNNPSKILTFIFWVGSSILFTSVINTFCHVFTDAATSFLRTVNGFVFSLPVILIVIVLNKIFVKYAFKR